MSRRCPSFDSYPQPAVSLALPVVIRAPCRVLSLKVPVSSSVMCLGEKLVPGLFLPLVGFPLHSDAVPKSSSETVLWDVFCTLGSTCLGRGHAAGLYLQVGTARSTQTHVQRDTYRPPEQDGQKLKTPLHLPKQLVVLRGFGDCKEEVVPRFCFLLSPSRP